MKRILGGLMVAVLALALLGGCPAYEAPSQPTWEEWGEGEVPTIPDAVNGADVPDGGEVTEAIGPPPELYDRTWISPGKVIVGNFYPGARAEYPVTVHNGSESNCSFTITCRPADHVDEPYVKAPSEVQDWVMIVDPTPILAPKETRDILVILELPEDAEVLAPKWEFWVSVIDTTQSGAVKTELCSRWLVAMR